MTESLKLKAAFSEAQTLDYMQISGTEYIPMGEKLLHPARMLIITRTLDQGVMLSTDGKTDMLYLPEKISDSETIVLDLSANKQGTGKFSFAAGTMFYIKLPGSLDPTAGKISITTIYGI